QATMAEVCAVYNVPSQMMSLSDRNMQSVHRSLYQDLLPPHWTAWEETLDRDLVPEFGDDRVFVEHLVEDKLRGSFLEQSKVLSVISGPGGFLTPNESRALLNYPPIQGGDQLIPPKGAAA